MTATAEPPLRVVAFGDSQASVWGALLDAGERAVVFGVPGAHGSAAGAGAVRFESRGGDDDGGWSVESDCCQLVVTPMPPQDGARGGAPSPAADELCQVHGTLIVDGGERGVDCPGILGGRPHVDVRRLDSIRGVWGWFADDQALSLLALRPRRHAAQEEDQLTATLFTDDGTIAVSEPRLSTTYDADGRPTSASLELWIGEDETEYPRRAAAEARGPAAVTATDGLTLQISPVRCHNRGLDGAGVYLIARFQ